MRGGAIRAPFQMLAPSTTTHTHARFIHTHTGTLCLLLLSANPQHQHNLLSGLRCCSHTKQATALPASLTTCSRRPCLSSVSATTPISAVQSTCVIKADNLTWGEKEKDDVSSSSHASAKPFIPKPMRMGQTVSAL